MRDIHDQKFKTVPNLLPESDCYQILKRLGKISVSDLVE